MSLADRLSDERGAMTILFALLIPTFLLFVAIGLTAGDWWVHKRHLQTQVDAAALAAVQDFQIPCTTLQGTIEGSVADWGGTRNPQVEGKQPNVSFAVNKNTYPGGGGGTDDTPVEDPCTSRMIDVKASEIGLKGPIPVGLIPVINAHARVTIFQASELDGLLPIAVPEPSPKQVKALFIDESASPPAVIASKDLSKDATDSSVWSNTASPLNVNIGSKSKIGVRIVLSGSSTSTTCGDLYVSCYDATSSNGLVFLQGWTANDGSGGQPNDPKIRSVTLASTSCDDPSFSASTTPCKVAVRAAIDFGSSVANPETAGPKAVVRVHGITLQGNKDVLLHYCATATTCGSSALVGLWTTLDTQTGQQELVPVNPAAGPIAISLDWAETAGTLNAKPGTTGTRTCSSQGNDPFSASKNPCTDSFGLVQRTFAGSDDTSGPLQLVQVFKDGTTISSLRQCESGNTACPSSSAGGYPLVVKIKIKGVLKPATSVDEPPISLRVATDNQTQALDCDPNRSLTQELALGCTPTYARNTNHVCQHKNDERALPQPWQCVAISTGNKPPQVADGLNTRILGNASATTCSNPSIPGYGQNRWATDFGHWSEADPRVIQLIITPFGSFSGTGTDDTVPVINFATFYVTGWQGNNGHNNPCQGNGDDPANPGFIVGHYISHIENTSQGNHGSDLCDFTSVTTCVAVLTR